VDRPGFGLPVRSPVERGDDEVGVVCRRAVENLFDERARRGHRRIERCERGPRFRLGRRELLGLVGEAERRDGQVARLEHCGFERGLPVSAGAGVRDPRLGQMGFGIPECGFAVVEDVVVRERDERGARRLQSRHGEGGISPKVVPLVRPARPAIGDATLQVSDQSVEFLKPRERRAPDVFGIVVVGPPLVDAPTEHQVADEPDSSRVVLGVVVVLGGLPARRSPQSRPIRRRRRAVRRRRPAPLRIQRGRRRRRRPTPTASVASASSRRFGERGFESSDRSLASTLTRSYRVLSAYRERSLPR